MSEVQIPKELQDEIEKFNTAQGDGEKLEMQVDQALDQAVSEPMEQMKAWKGEVSSEQPKEDEKPGLMRKINKAGKWIRGAFAAGAVMVGSEALANDRQAEMEGAHRDAQSMFEKASYQRKAERSSENKRVDDLKKTIVQVVESRFPGAGARAEKECDQILKELGDAEFITKINALDEFGKKLIASKGEVKHEAKRSNDWRGEVDSRAANTQEHMTRTREAFKMLFSKKIPYETALAALEKELEPGVQGQLNGLNFERKKDGTIYVQGIKLSPESRAQMAK